MHQYPQRSVEGNCLYSSDIPAIRVQLARSLEYLGNLKSKIHDVAHIDNYYFADRDENGIIQRIVYLQFEGYFPEVEGSYEYPNTQPIQMANFDFVYDGGLRNYRQSRIDELDPQTDVVQTVAFPEGKLMVFALGRTVEYHDMPAVRAIVREAAEHDYRFESIVLGIVRSDAFQMRQVPLPQPAEGTPATTAQNPSISPPSVTP